MKIKTWCIFLVFIISKYSCAITQSEAEEYNLKAAFIFNFTKFIEWEPTDSDEVFIIGIVGPSMIRESLTEIAKTKTINNKKIIILEFNNPDEITFCNILFISQKSPFDLNFILENKSIARNTLIVTERNGSALQGACINFVILNNKLKFETNINAINSRGLKASSQLLKLAIIVN
jgi:hypothetical protein